MCYVAAMEPPSPTDAALVEVQSASCGRCGRALTAAEFSGGESSAWPVVVAGDALLAEQRHRDCGGPLELGDVRPAGHVCPEDCECGSGGLPERVVW